MKQATALFGAMLANGYKPSLRLYNNILDGLHDAGNLDASQYSKILKDMVSKGCVPDLNSYNILIASSCQARKTDDAYALLQLMKANDCVLDNMTFSAMMCGLCILKKADKAYTLYKKMLMKQSPPAIHVCKLLAVFAKRGEAGISKNGSKIFQIIRF
ncbi:hypothetical protein L7F22_034127 [Adiantum nelumboides]|nr:hypothetical protein [Adiantum nelumboides]